MLLVSGLHFDSVVVGVLFVLSVLCLLFCSFCCCFVVALSVLFCLCDSLVFWFYRLVSHRACFSPNPPKLNTKPDFLRLCSQCGLYVLLYYSKDIYLLTYHSSVKDNAVICFPYLFRLQFLFIFLFVYCAHRTMVV